jgi:hypothetical protein
MAYDDADAFCAQTDVEAHVGRGAYTATTQPTGPEVLDFMAERAGQIQARLSAVGYAATPASGSAPISTASDDGKALERLVRKVNAMLAAGDVVAAHDTRDDPEAPPPAKALWEEGYRVLGELLAFAAGVLAVALRSKVNSPQELEVEDLIHVTQKW